MPEQSRRDKAHENMQVYAPIAHRLGIKTIKDELEDLSLQYIDTIGYKEIEDAISLSENDRDKFIESIDVYKRQGIFTCRRKSGHFPRNRQIRY